jgi:hypothetical protein
MSATEEEVQGFLKSGTELACKVGGGVMGAILGSAMAGPPGAVLGAALTPFLEHQLNRLSREFVGRQLGERQRSRAGAGAILLAAAVQRHLDEGKMVRGDDFDPADATGRRPMDEVAEHAIMSMISSVDERRLPYLANLYAGLYFAEEISRASVPIIVSIADALSYRSFCLLRIVADRRLYTGSARAEAEERPWPQGDHITAKEVYSLTGAGLLVVQAEGDDSLNPTLGYGDVEPGLLKLSPIGEMLVDKMVLASIPDGDPALIEAQQSLQRIASAPAASWNIDGGTTWATNEW